MGRARKGVLAACGVIGLLLSAFGAAALQFFDGIDAVEAAARYRTSVREAVLEGRVEGSGTWALTDGSRSGEWQLAMPPRLTERGTWTVTLSARDGQSSGRASQLSAEKLPVELTAEIPADGHLRDTEFDLVQKAAIGGTDVAIQSDSSSEHVDAFPFAGKVWGEMNGVRLEGEFISPQGAPGTWSGWWHAWTSREQATVSEGELE
jgi:hypothetical protein